MIYIDVQKKLFNNQDKKYQQFMLMSIPNEANIIGVRMPIIKKIVSEIFKQGNADVYLLTEPVYHEERMIQGLICAKKVKSVKDINLIKSFVPKITNWAVCDSFCLYLKAIQTDLNAFYLFFRIYLKSANEFEVRFGLVLLLNFYVSKEYLQDIFDVLDCFNHNGYYAKMGAAWLLSICYIKCPVETKKYLFSSRLDSDTFNKSIQKIIESKCVEKSEHSFLKNLKRI